VDHLDIVSGTSLTDPVTTGLALDLSSSSLEYFFDGRPCIRRATGHEGRAVSSTLLTTGDTRANEQETLGLEFLGAADGVGVMRVTTVDNDVTLLKVGLELSDEAVNCRTGLDEKNDLSRTLKLGDELLNRVCALDLGTFGREQIKGSGGV